MVQQLLIVDDEKPILNALSKVLGIMENVKVHTANNAKDALKICEQIHPSVVITDLKMPEMDGIETCVEIRESKEIKDTLVALLTARSEDYSQIAGFDSGADDYITKPLKPRVLMSRIKALLRRKAEKNTDSASTAELFIDTEKYVVFQKGKELLLPKKEFELLALLFSKPGKVFTRDVILNKVWGDDIIVGDRTIDVHVRKLREKLGDGYIKTVKGVGYKLKLN